jgi:hypothetical protein
MSQGGIGYTSQSLANGSPMVYAVPGNKLTINNKNSELSYKK